MRCAPVTGEAGHRGQRPLRPEEEARCQEAADGS